MTARLIIGDVRQALTGLPDNSVDLIVTSPPFLALRNYLPADHPDKALEIGSEATPAEFLDVLLELTAEWRRILTPHGSIAVELGDTYAGSGGAGGDYNAGGLRDGQDKFDGAARRGRLATYKDDRGNPAGMRDTTFSGANTRNGGGPGWPLDKCLTGIPALYQIALTYGVNPLRVPLTARQLVDYFELIVEDMRAAGYEPPALELLRMMNDYIDRYTEVGPYREFERWRVRNKIAWCRPNPPVGALGDKSRPGTSYITVATIARDRWFDLEELRTPTDRFDLGGNGGREFAGGRSGGDERGGPHSSGSNSAGAPPLDWWNLLIDRIDRELRATAQRAVQGEPQPDLFGGTEGTGKQKRQKETAASKLIRAAVLAGEIDEGDGWNIPTQPYKGAHYATFPEELPRRLILAMCPREVCVTCGKPRRRIVSDDTAPTLHPKDSKREGEQLAPTFLPRPREVETLGWTDCQHDNNWRPGIVLDPFAGSGTTLTVAQGLGRDSIGIDLDDRNADLCRARVGMFLEVEHKERAA